MVDWRTLKVGDKVRLHTEEFGVTGDWDGVVTEVAEDHAIMTDEFGARNWIDDDFAQDYFRINRHGKYWERG